MCTAKTGFTSSYIHHVILSGYQSQNRKLTAVTNNRFPNPIFQFEIIIEVLMTGIIMTAGNIITTGFIQVQINQF